MTAQRFDVRRALADMTAAVDTYLDQLKDLVSIDSGTFDKEGVDEVRQRIAGLYQNLGGRLEVIPRNDVGDILRIEFTGTGTSRVLMLGHLDTVYPAGTVARRPFSVRDGKAWGPGTADMKAGDLSIVHAISLLQRQGYSDFGSVVVIHNSDEEIGSGASRDLIREEALEVDAALVLEAGRENGAIVSGRKGIASFAFEITGVPAHAGVNHERGRSAVLEMAHLVIALEGLNGTVPGATLNVGRVQGGSHVNVVPAAAACRLEVRAFEQARLEDMVEQVRRVLETRTVPDTRANLEWAIDHMPMHKSEATQRLVDLARDLGTEIGVTIVDTRTGGASDGNTVAAAGRPVLDGLGPIGGGAHSEAEYIDIASIAPRTAILAGLIAGVSPENSG